MAYVPGYENDLFVSYASEDDDALLPDDSGWVTTLFEFLKKKLPRHLGRSEEFKLWKDHRLGCSEPLTPQLLNQVRGSATLLVIMSRPYLDTRWCAAGGLSRKPPAGHAASHHCGREGRHYARRASTRAARPEG